MTQPRPGREAAATLAGMLRGGSRGAATLIPHIAATAISVVLFTAIYPPFSAGAVAFVALTPVVLVFTNPNVRCGFLQALLFGFGFGLCASLAIVGPWMFSAAFDYFQHGLLWSLGFTVLVNTAYVAVFLAGAFLCLRLLAGAPPIVRVFGAASVWITFEALRSADPLGNRWALLGQGLVDVPVLREAAVYGGDAFLGWMAALCAAAIGVGLQPDLDTGNARRCMILGVLSPLVLSALGAGEHFRDQDVAPLQPLRVAVVQAEIPSRDVWDPSRRIEHWEAYYKATETLKPGSVDLVVWPESAVPFLLDSDSASRSKLMQLATTMNASILLGAPRSAAAGEGRAVLYNSAYFFAPDLDEVRTYDKRRLLPFVEEMPLSVLGQQAAATPPYAEGESAEWFDVRGWRLAPLLCFEALYPEYAREAVRGGAHLLVNLSNDAWFDAGAGPEQHASMSWMRAPELRRPMVRAANGGVSGAVGPGGAPIGIPLARQKAVGVYEIPSPPRRITAAATWGGYVPLAIGAVAALCLLLSLLALSRVET